jgi:hypothetical protein
MPKGLKTDKNFKTKFIEGKQYSTCGIFWYNDPSNVNAIFLPFLVPR